MIETAARSAEKKDWEGAALALAGAESTTEVLRLRAWYWSRAKRYGDALEALGELRRRDPNDFRALYMTGYQYYEQGIYTEALPWFDRALAISSRHLTVLWRKAYATRAVGNQAGALACAAQIISFYAQLPDSEKVEHKQVFAKASHMLGKADLESRNPQFAVELFQQAAEAEPGDPYHHQLLGKALTRTGRAAEAVDSLKRARRIKPGDLNIELELAKALVASGDPEGGVAILGRLQERCRGWIAYKGGRIALRAGRPDLAVRLLDRASRDPETRGNPDVLGALADANDAATRTSSVGPGPIEASAAATATGKVDQVNPDRGFGFLVDETGTRRHFRVRGRLQLRRGDVVQFRPIDAERGPAARDVVKV